MLGLVRGNTDLLFCKVDWHSVLAMPISWHGTLAQYAGRLHRLHHAKKQVIIYDYVDAAIPMLAKMAEKRRKGYERLGYQIGTLA